MRERALAPRPFEMRPVEPPTPIRSVPHEAQPPRAHGVAQDRRASSPTIRRCIRYLLAYASDHSFVTTALLPHGVTWLTPGMQVASLDHVMWFHQPFRVDEWLLYVIDSPAAHGARGLVRGRVFSQRRAARRVDGARGAHPPALAAAVVGARRARSRYWPNTASRKLVAGKTTRAPTGGGAQGTNP